MNNNPIYDLIAAESLNSVSCIIDYTFIKLINKRFNDTKYFNIIWNLLHLISVEYPDNPSDKLKQSTINFIKQIKQISCSTCANNDILVENDIITSVQSRHSFIQFLINYHSTINKRTKNNTSNIFSVDSIIQKYKDYDYKSFFNSTYNIDIDYLIAECKLDVIYDKLPDIKTQILTQNHIDVKIIVN
jgi:hypothetical protein